MYTLNARGILVCSRGTQFLKRFTQEQPPGCVCLSFATSNVDRSKRKKPSSSLFTPVKIKPCSDSENIGEELTGSIRQTDLLKVINAFSRLPAVKTLAAENGIDESLYLKGFLSFRKYCIDSKTLPTDLHVVVSDILNSAGNPVDIFPYFLRHVRQIFPHLECTEDLKKIGDIRQPADWYPETRAMKRKIFFHSGPTNSGKTYHAIKNFINAKTGIYCGPLKLLAVEIYEKTNESGTPCDLVTGDEIICKSPSGDHSTHSSCTIEMCPLDRIYDVAIIDEIQMLKDPQRGWAWTRALLGLKAKEIHLCGEEAAVNVVDSILCTTNEELEVKNYERLTELSLDTPVKKFSSVQPGDCIVCFNKNDIYTVANSLEALGHKVGVVYGSLPPKTKMAQCEKFNDPNDPCKILVATDAVGMGLNLTIRRVIFYSLSKSVVNEVEEAEKSVISVSQALQIAGRAGRFGTKYEKGLVTTFKQSDYDILKHLLSQKPETVQRCGLLPTIDQIELFSYYLPKSTLTELIDILISFSTVDNSLYFMCDLKDFKVLTHMIDHVPMPLKTKFVFCCAPVNKKSYFVCVMFVKFAKMYSANQAVRVSWICSCFGWPLTKPVNLRELAHLETCHEVLELYLWLSFRFPEYFPDADLIRKLQTVIDRLIQEGVANLTELKKANESKNGKLQEEWEIPVQDEKESVKEVEFSDHFKENEN